MVTSRGMAEEMDASQHKFELRLISASLKYLPHLKESFTFNLSLTRRIFVHFPFFID